MPPWASPPSRRRHPIFKFRMPVRDPAICACAGPSPSATKIGFWTRASNSWRVSSRTRCASSKHAIRDWRPPLRELMPRASQRQSIAAETPSRAARSGLADNSAAFCSPTAEVLATGNRPQLVPLDLHPRSERHGCRRLCDDGPIHAGRQGTCASRRSCLVTRSTFGSSLFGGALAGVAADVTLRRAVALD